MYTHYVPCITSNNVVAKIMYFRVAAVFFNLKLHTKETICGLITTVYYCLYVITTTATLYFRRCYCQTLLRRISREWCEHQHRAWDNG